MSSSTDNRSVHYGEVHIQQDGTIIQANDYARQLLKLPEKKHIKIDEAIKDSRLQIEIKKGVHNPSHTFTYKFAENKCLFLFKPVLEQGSADTNSCVMTLFNIEQLIEDSKSDIHSHLLTSIGEMSAGIAHEVRNPLTAVKGFLQMLDKNYNKKYVDIAQSELERAVNTLNDLLSVAKPGLTEEEKVPINICSELESLLLLFQNQLYDIKVVKKMTHPKAEVIGKRNQLKKALFNLVKNAIEAMPDGGTLTIEQSYDHEGIHIKIKDTGTGIPKDKLAMLGTPFFSLKSNGTGMGLTQVYATVKEHKGMIQVDSIEGKGTKFHIILPIDQISKQEFDDYWEGKKMVIEVKSEQSLVDYLTQNAKQYSEMWFKYIEQTKDYVGELKEDEKNFKEEFENLFSLIASSIHQVKEYEILNWAEQEGTKRAKLDISITILLELFQTYRDVIWKAIAAFYETSEENIESAEFFALERKINHLLDLAVQHFTSYYVKYKNELLQTHRQIVDDLSVPVIPLTNDVCLLPIVGHIDTYRAQKIREKTLQQVKELKAETLILDISGVPYIDTAVANHLFKIEKGLRLLGSKTFLTGISAEIADTIVELGIDIDKEVTITADLQKALQALKVV